MNIFFVIPLFSVPSLSGGHMTAEERKRIERLRRNGNSFSRIAEIMGLSSGSIRMYCRRNGIEPAATDSNSYCLRCGNELLHKKRGRTALFCSSNCRVLYWRALKTKVKDNNYLHVCPGCGEEFFAIKPSRKYCSHGCYINARFGEGRHGA